MTGLNNRFSTYPNDNLTFIIIFVVS